MINKFINFDVQELIGLKSKYINYGISQYIYEALLYEHLNSQNIYHEKIGHVIL